MVKSFLLLYNTIEVVILSKYRNKTSHMIATAYKANLAWHYFDAFSGIYKMLSFPVHLLCACYLLNVAPNSSDGL